MLCSNRMLSSYTHGAVIDVTDDSLSELLHSSLDGTGDSTLRLRSVSFVSSSLAFENPSLSPPLLTGRTLELLPASFDLGLSLLTGGRLSTCSNCLPELVFVFLPGGILSDILEEV
uniref:Uncharacterized protein n=1 Tax=Cacopsylla melanoneura TaxID=428564 RepID=A0A8D8YAR5_9HEMI